MRTRSFWIVLVISLFAVSAFAGWRTPTEQEQQFYRHTLQVISGAMPAGPSSWQLTAQTEIRELERVYAGSEREPFRTEYFIEWNNLEQQRSHEQDVTYSMVDYQQNNPRNPEIEVLNKEKRRVAELVGKAAGEGDVAGMQRHMKEIDAIDSKLRAIQDAAATDVDKMRAAKEAHDTRLRITVKINNFVQAYEKMNVAPSIAGLQVYRVPGGHVNGQWNEDTYRVFIGKGFRLIPGNGMLLVRRAAVPPNSYLTVQLIEVEVRADKERAEQALRIIDWKALQAMMK